jgi:hypothetical protein
MTEPTPLISTPEASPNLTEPRTSESSSVKNSCRCWSRRRGGHVLSAHQGGEPLRPMPLEITRCLRVPGAELAPPPPLVRRGFGRVIAVDTPWPNGQACHSCGRRRLVPASGCWWRHRGCIRGRYPQHVLAPRLGRLRALCAACRACGRPSMEGTPPSSRHPDRPPTIPECDVTSHRR